MTTHQQTIMNSLKDKGPEVWLAYLRPFEEGQPLTGLHMQVIFHYTAPKAKEQDSLGWAEVAVRAAELEALNSNGPVRENAMVGAMRLRSWFIARMGSRASHYVLDKEIILRWAEEGLDLPIQTAEEKAAGIWRDSAGMKTSSNPDKRQCVHDDLRQLRRIKRRLGVVKVLADCGELPNDSILYDWLEIRGQLP